MLDVLRRYASSLAGVTELSRDRAEALVRELQDRGEIRSRDVQRAARQLVERSARNRQELVRLVRKEIQRQVKALGLVTREDLDRVARRVKALESGTTKTRPRQAAAKPSGGRGSASSTKKT